MIKKYSITVNGNNYDVEVEELSSEGVEVSRPQVQNQSTKRPQTTPKAAQVAKAAPVGGAGNINAPMPGTINDVRVKVGDSVKKGNVLLILEAMKMENELVASCDGTVTAVNVAKGASVSVGDSLVTIG